MFDKIEKDQSYRTLKLQFKSKLKFDPSDHMYLHMRLVKGMTKV